MIVVNDISNSDLITVVNKQNQAFNVFQLRPKTFFNQQYFPAECLIDFNEAIIGFVLIDSIYVLTLEDLNAGLNSDFASLQDFFDTMAENEYLIID
jgi:hypothetical protein